MNDGQRFRIDDLRRFVAGLAANAGLAPTRAAALATHLLWYDLAGAPELGIASLPGWLERMARGDFDLSAEGRVVSERAGTVVLDGQRGLPPLLLARAAALAGEKARDVGIGLVRLAHIGPAGSAAEVAAEVAIGPEIALVFGPESSWTLAVPSAEGLPAVFDSSLARLRSSARPPADLETALAPWSLLAAEGGWLVAVLAVPALEPLAAFHERISAAMKADRACPSLLKPGPWEAHRNELRLRGVPLPAAALRDLTRWAERFGFHLPEPCSIPPS